MLGNGSSSLVKGAFLLTLAGLISKVLSAGYRIPLQNLTGDMGFYIYQQVYPLLGMALVLALYGFPSAISKITAEQKASGKNLSLRNFYMPVIIILFVIMGVISGLLYISAESLAGWVGDAGLAKSYKLAAGSLLVIPFTALLRGVFQGNFLMKPTAYSQVGEQLARVFLIILIAISVSDSEGSLYQIGEGAAIASLIGSLTALVILLLFTRKKKALSVTTDCFIPWAYYIRTIFLLGLVAALNHMVLLLLQFADAFTLIPALTEYGLAKADAMEAKGVLDRGQPLIQLGTVLGSSFALAMIPSISRKQLKEKQDVFYQNIRSSLAIGFYLAAGATVGLIAIMPEANLLLFQDDKGTLDLQILVLAILLSSVSITASTILQGMGYIKRTALFIFITLLLKWALNQVLVPHLGITGGALATVLSLLGLFLLVMLELKRKLPNLGLIRQIKWRTLFLATTGMLAFIFLINRFIPVTETRTGALIYVLFVVVTGACVYLIILFRGRAFTAKEISMLPFSKLWMRMYKERN